MPSEEIKPDLSATDAPVEEKPKAKAKVEKVKLPTVEELPFEEFIASHYVPALTKALSQKGLADLELKYVPTETQVQGTWKGKLRQFTVYFSKQDINALKAFSCADSGNTPSTIEPFLVDERKSTLDLLVFGVVQRLNAQKWLQAN